ncbi:DUF2127 domain-containing protein [Herbaspirillum sp. HC18]|nr:DUF2127 domain-containing protein [Herbaspirillum sp. HC18]
MSVAQGDPALHLCDTHATFTYSLRQLHRPIDQSKVPDSGIRAVALFEAAKGILVLLVGGGLLSLVHGRHAQHLAEAFMRHLHFDLPHRYPHIFFDLAQDVTNTKLWMFAGVAFAYASIRLIEAYGLWRQRQWAEWFAVASGSIYLPFEAYELIRGVSWIKVSALTINIVIVAYMAYAVGRQRRYRTTQTLRTTR